MHAFRYELGGDAQTNAAKSELDWYVPLGGVIEPGERRVRVLSVWISL